MKIAHASDFHYDFYASKGFTANKFIEQILQPEPADVLIISGDIGHYNNQNIQLLIKLKEYYPHILLCIGNHDLYLVSKGQRNKYQCSSQARYEEFKAMCVEADIHLLDGNTFSIGSTTFGGLPMWYDVSDPVDYDDWLTYMNDSKLIMEGKPYAIDHAYGHKEHVATFDPTSFYEDQVAKLADIRCDVLFSHVCPFKRPEALQDPRYLGHDFNLFYESDNLDLVKATGASHLLFGHTHTNIEHTYEGIQVHTNAIGYPQEQLYNKLNYFTV